VTELELKMDTEEGEVTSRLCMESADVRKQSECRRNNSKVEG
jgi:hypothetical protein